MISKKQRTLEKLLNEFIQKLDEQEKCTCADCLGWYIMIFLERCNRGVKFP
jgi:hypothetical protein